MLWHSGVRPALLLILFLATPAAHAAPAAPRPGLLTGEIRERGTRSPVAGAPIIALAPGLPIVETESDAEGRFTLPVAPGTLQVTVLGPAHLRLEIVELVAAGQRIEVRYAVERASYGRYQTVVRGANPREEVSRITLSNEEAARIPGTNGDAVRAVETLPGVGRAPLGLGLFIIRGAKPTDSRVFLEGLEVPQLYHFGGARAVVNSDLIERIDYLPGNFDARFGRAEGGVIDLGLRAGRADRLHGALEFNLIDAGFLVEGPIGKGSFLLAARRSYIDALLGAVVGAFVSTERLSFTSAPVYYDYQAQLDHPFAGGRVRLLLHGSDDRLEFVVKNPLGDPSLRGAFETTTWFHKLQATYTRRDGPFELVLSQSTGWQSQGAPGCRSSRRSGCAPTCRSPGGPAPADHRREGHVVLHPIGA
ncbi:MAG: hypothetical protein EXR72_23880 [Myxococcales bacterium]|nr:hypothetical protein [Myxococcales bacterium]